jgi:hypothetical protein
MHGCSPPRPGSRIARTGTPVQGRFAPATPVAFGILEPASPSERRELHGRDGGTGASTEQRNIDGRWVRKPLSDPALRFNGNWPATYRRRQGCLEQNRKSGQITCYLNRTSIGAVNTTAATASPLTTAPPGARIVAPVSGASGIGNRRRIVRAFLGLAEPAPMQVPKTSTRKPCRARSSGQAGGTTPV